MQITHAIQATIPQGRRLLSNAGVAPTERKMVEDALAKVSSCVARANLYLRANKDEAAGADEKAVIRKWFGNASRDACVVLEKRYKDMVSVFSRKVNVWRFTGNIGDPAVPVGDQEAANFYAQVISEAGTQFSNKSVDIEFADTFFAAQSAARQLITGLTDERVRAGTVIHETSHRIWVVEGNGMSAVLSDDFAYDWTACRTLAKRRATYARANADNIMYFALEFFDTDSPAVPRDELADCRYLRNPSADNLDGDLDELNGNSPVHLTPLSGD